jgi:hypothetical protein
MPEFLAATKKLMDDAERGKLLEYLAYNPTAGDVIQGPLGFRRSRQAVRSARNLLLS